MKRGLENSMLMNSKKKRNTSSGTPLVTPANQSILVSGESGAGQTVTTKIVLNYFAMLSKQIVREENERRSFLSEQRSLPMNRMGSMNSSSSSASRNRRFGSGSNMSNNSNSMSNSNSSINKNLLNAEAVVEDVCIEQQVLQSNPILEAFGNARTLRNDNSSGFRKYIDIWFTSTGQLSAAKIETYLLEKVQLIHPSVGERNYHVFYQFIEPVTKEEREVLGL